MPAQRGTPLDPEKIRHYAPDTFKQATGTVPGRISEGIPKPARSRDMRRLPLRGFRIDNERQWCTASTNLLSPPRHQQPVGCETENTVGKTHSVATNIHTHGKNLKTGVPDWDVPRLIHPSRPGWNPYVPRLVHRRNSTNSLSRPI